MNFLDRSGTLSLIASVLLMLRFATSGRQRLVESLGFQREALLRDHWLDKGEVSDSTIYGVLRREWSARKEST